jgi:guanylate kinase
VRSDKGILFVVSAPSGAGKSTLCAELIKSGIGVRFGVSHTTRSPRPGEEDGREYHFVSREEFDRMKGGGEFVEWAEVHGNLYGTSKAMIDGLLGGGQDVLHDIDVQGARQLREVFPDAVYVFVIPPSGMALRERLEGRGSESGEVAALRLANARAEMESYSEYDYVILNDSLEDAVEEFSAVVRAARLRASRVEPGWVRENLLTEEDV